MNLHSRVIRPGLFVNELLGECEPWVRLLFIGLWCIGDRDGRLEDRPVRIRAELFPYDNGLDVDSALADLACHGFIQRYEVNGTEYIQINNFGLHQPIHHRERSMEFPEPQPDAEPRGKVREPRAKVREGSHNQHGNGNGNSTGKGKDKRKQKPCRKPDKLPDTVYPYQDVLDDLNQRSGKTYEPNIDTVSKIIHLFNIGKMLDDFKYVHAVKCAEWMGTEREKWIRPKTLYNPENFESYRNQPMPGKGTGLSRKGAATAQNAKQVMERMKPK